MPLSDYCQVKGDSMAKLIQQIKDLIAIYKAIKGLQQILSDVTPELKADIQALAKDIDEVIAKISATPDTLDDKVIPFLQVISDWLKKISS